MKLTLVIPCYNEAKNLPLLVGRIRESFRRTDVEVVLVDNGSTDDSPQVLKQLLAEEKGIRSLRVEVNRGYGFGILSGLRATDAEYIGWCHADMQTDPADALRALEVIESQPDLAPVYVKGKRYGRPFSDVFFTVGMSLFETLFLRTPLWDVNAQPNIFPRTFFESWINPPADFSLDLFAFYQARVSRLKVVRIPVYFGKRAHGVSHWNVNWAAKWKFIKRTLDFSFKLRRSLQGA
jgi:glycosyltransferase involved in cell wall biosynthesis